MSEYESRLRINRRDALGARPRRRRRARHAAGADRRRAAAPRAPAPPPPRRPPRAAHRRPPERSAAPSRSARTTPTRPRRPRSRAVHGRADRHGRAGQGQHGRPQHVPEEHQHLPAGHARTTCFTWFAGYRMQFFAAQGLLAPDRRRLGEDRRQLRRRGEVAVEGPRRQVLPRADLQLPVGRLLQQERLRGEGLHRSRRPGTTSSRSRRR